MICQFCEKRGHTARQCNAAKKLFFTASAPTANPTTTSNNMASNWLLDSGASHDVTSDISNLSLHQPYEGPDDIVIGDGTGLNITHVGKSTLSTPSHSFSLSNVLCVPSMKQNLISVSQFCKTNNSSIEILSLFLLCEGYNHGGTTRGGTEQE